MSKNPGFDTALAHRFFSADCFNKTWEFIEKPERTPDDDERMIRLAQTSMWHWTNRPDCKRQQISIGYWLLTRVYAIAGRTQDARRYADLCLQNSQGEAAFYLAYAYEALARAEKAGGNSVLTAEYKAEAARLAETVDDAGDRKALSDDLASI